MGVRFNKRITILPWLKANVGKSGVSLSIGPKGKTLNVGSTGVNVNVSLGKGVGYSKRFITWKKLNLLSWLGIGGAAAATKATKGKGTKRGKKGTTAATDLSLDEAIEEAEAVNGSVNTTEENANAQQEQAGCSWGCAAIGCLASLVLLACVIFLLYYLIHTGALDLSSLQPSA